MASGSYLWRNLVSSSLLVTEFYPTLLYNVLKNKIQAEFRWWDWIDEDKKLKELYEDIPTLEELHALALGGLRAEVIPVDAVKDKKLSTLML